MISVEVSYELRVYDVPGRYPLSLLRSVAFPIDQVLPASAPIPNCQKSLNFVHQTSFNDLGWWWGRGGRYHLAFFYRFDLTNVECRVYS